MAMRLKPTFAAGVAAALLSVALLAQPGGARAGEYVAYFGGVRMQVPTVSIREGRFQTVILQQYDYSCGSAALATLLTYHYERPTTEQDVFLSMYATGEQAKIQQVGFSLLDMKRYLERRGLRADGFKMDLAKLIEIGAPAIALINLSGYNHFVVLKGAEDGKVVVGDPALGVRVYTYEQFSAIWNGVAFLIRSEPKVGRDHFNLARDWSVRRKAPYATAISRDALASFTAQLPFATNEF
jgi:predicted double-glycine peptidase